MTNSWWVIKMTNFFMKMTNFFLSKWRILFIKMTNFFLSKWRTSFLCIIKMTNFWSTHWNRWNKSFRIIVYSHESSSANRVPENIFQTQIFLALITDISEIRRAEATFKDSVESTVVTFSWLSIQNSFVWFFIWTNVKKYTS